MKKLFCSQSIRGNSDVTSSGSGFKVDPATYTTTLQGKGVVLLSTGLYAPVMGATSTVAGIVASHDIATGEISLHKKGTIAAIAASANYAAIAVGDDVAMLDGEVVEPYAAGATPVLGTVIAKGITGVLESGVEVADCVEVELK